MKFVIIAILLLSSSSLALQGRWVNPASRQKILAEASDQPPITKPYIPPCPASKMQQYINAFEKCKNFSSATSFKLCVEAITKYFVGCVSKDCTEKDYFYWKAGHNWCHKKYGNDPVQLKNCLLAYNMRYPGCVDFVVPNPCTDEKKKMLYAALNKCKKIKKWVKFMTCVKDAFKKYHPCTACPKWVMKKFQNILKALKKHLKKKKKNKKWHAKYKKYLNKLKGLKSLFKDCKFPAIPKTSPK